MVKRLIGVTVAAVLLLGFAAPVAACYRHLPPSPRFGRIYRRPPRPHRHHCHRNDRAGAVIAGVIIGAIIASR